MVIKMLLIIAALVTLSAASTRPLKALLYCYVPVDNSNDPMPELENFRALINSKLRLEGINVEVDFCDVNGNSSKLYSNEINELLEAYDILEIDIVAMPAITKPLMKFQKKEISYYDQVFPFQWDTVTEVEGTEEYILASPGLMCDNFLKTRKRSNLKQQLLINGGFGKYQAMDLYHEIYLNLGEGRTLQDVNASSLDPQVVQQLANFLTLTQQNQVRFNYEEATCFREDYESPSVYFSDNMSSIMSYSQFSSTILAVDPHTRLQDLEIRGTFDYRKKLVYLDQFVAAQSGDDPSREKKETILKFYEFMLSDDVLDLYVYGKYKNSPGHTYVLPPKISYFQRLMLENTLYHQVYKALFEDKEVYATNSANYWNNIKLLQPRLKEALKALSEQLNQDSGSEEL